MNITITESDQRGNAQMYDFDSIKSEHAFKLAENRNEKVVLPAEDELLIDIDSLEDYNYFILMVDKFSLHVNKVVRYWAEPSRSREAEHYHMYVKLTDRVNPQERILYQALLGSDRARELFSLVRYLNDDEHPTLFIEPTEPLMLAPAPEPKGLLGTGEELQMACDHAAILTDEEIPLLRRRA